jgi:LacI family transcriptional regulator
MPRRKPPNDDGFRENAAASSHPLDDARPKYRILQDLIRQGIADGTLVEKGKLPSEYDMARQFGVAYMTVRAAVNHLVAEGTLERFHGRGTFVRPDRPPAPTGRGTLAFVVPSLQMLWNVAGLYYFPSIMQGFCAEATRLGYEPTVIGRTKDGFGAGGAEWSGVVGAACLLIAREDTEALENLRDRRLPVVGINRYRGRRAIPYVAADQAGGIGAAVRMLAGRGHRHIGFVPGPLENLGAEERRRGFINAVAELDVVVSMVDDPAADYTESSGYLRMHRLLERTKDDERPTAIVTAGDLIAAGVLKAAREAGLAVPDSLSVVGCGDFQVATYLQPALTTVRLPLVRLGARAAEVLHDSITGTARRRSVTLHTMLVERDSVADFMPPKY